MRYDLITPVTMPDGSVVKTVILRLVTIKYYPAIQKHYAAGDDFEAAMATIGGMTGLTAEFAGELDPRDFLALSKLAPRFIPKA